MKSVYRFGNFRRVGKRVINRFLTNISAKVVVVRNEDSKK